MALLSAAAVPAPASAHIGGACGFETVGETTTRLQAECFARADAHCDPDVDGEHTQIYTGGLPPGVDGSLVMAPRHACSLYWDDVVFPLSRAIGGFQVLRPNAALAARVELYVDGAPAGTGSFTGVSGGGYQWVALSGTPPLIPAGVHDLRARYFVTSGAQWINLLLDFVDLDPRCNRSPVVSSAYTLSMPGGHVWRDLPYDYHVSASDPDADPLGYLWTFGDGHLSVDTDVVHTFTTSGARPVTMRVHDDPTARCPEDPALDTTRWLNLTVIDEGMAKQTRPLPGRSCIDDLLVVTSLETVYAGDCTLQAEFASPLAPVASAEFFVDDRSLGADTSAPYEMRFRSIDHSIGDHTWSVCFRMTLDLHGRVACAGPIPFFNAGLIGPG